MKLIEKIPIATDEARELVLECEREVSAELETLTEDTLSKNNRLITLSGPTCSGKTTAAEKLSDAIEKKATVPPSSPLTIFSKTVFGE